MTEPEQEPEPKIVVDEDWKSQVQAEKEALAGKSKDAAAAPDEVAAQAAAPSPAAEPQDRGWEEDLRLPEASLAALVTMLATQAMIAMGQVPHPLTGKPERHLPEAKYLIDLIAMLEAKTQGNRTPQEIAMLSSVLHELRLAFVAAQSAPEPAK